MTTSLDTSAVLARPSSKAAPAAVPGPPTSAGRGQLLPCPIVAAAVGASTLEGSPHKLGSAPPLGGRLGFVSHTTTTLKEGST